MRSRFGSWFENGGADFARGGGRGRHGRGGGGGEGGGGGPFGGGPPWGGGHPFGGWFGQRLRARRGNVRSAILTVLGEESMNGYQLMQAIEQRSEGTWRPSSGSIYPTLQQLEDEGLVEAEDARASQGSSRTYKLTAKGKRHVAEHRDELEADWATPPVEGLRTRQDIMQTFKSVAAAAMQIVTNGTPSQIAEAKKLLVEVRRNLYRILADDPATAGATGDDD